MGLKQMFKRAKVPTGSGVVVTCIHDEGPGCARCATEAYEATPEPQFENLAEPDVKRCVLGLPDNVQRVLRQYNKQVVLAGGYIRAQIAHERVADIDLFVNNDKSFADTVASGIGVAEHRIHCYEIDTAPRTQVIYRWEFESPREVIERFDFVVTKAAIWFGHPDNKWHGICDRGFYADLAAKRLTYTPADKDENATSSMLRVIKYVQRGYVIPKDSLAGVVVNMIRRADIFEGLDEDKLKAQLLADMALTYPDRVLPTDPYEEPVKTSSGWIS